MNNHRQRGFTLIEMLLVVSLIVLLISLLLPALNKGFDATKTSTCKSHLAAIYSATQTYALENRKRAPSGRQGSWGWVQSPWYNIDSVRNGVLYDYMGQNEKAYLCPKFLDVYKKWNPSNNNLTAAFSYSLNEYMGNSWQGRPGIKTINGATRPAELCMYTDENAWVVRTPVEHSRHAINNGAMGVGWIHDPGSIVDGIGSFHDAPNGNLNDGSSNVLFVDGHVNLEHISRTKIVCTPHRYW